MPVLLPLDDNGHPIGVLGFAPRGTERVAVSATSARSAPISPDIEIVTLVATGYCRFEVGNATVTADRDFSAFLYPGVYVDVPLRRGERHVAFVADEACDAYVIRRR